jgi:hypothetical protein
MADGEQIIDSSGNIWEYNAEQDEWIYRGVIEVPDIVTFDQDGLVYPSVYRKMLLIQELMDRGLDFGVFKLDTPGSTPYYYFFYSSDDLIRFYPETGSKLRIEFDRNRLYQKLLRTCCAGPKGLQGLTGAAGRSGIAAANEKFKFPTSITAGAFEFSTTVATPIDTAISLRLFRNDTELLVEYLLEVSGTNVVSINAAGEVLSEDELAAAELESEARGEAAEGNIDGALTKLQEILDLGINGRVQSIIDTLNETNVWPEQTAALQIIVYDDDIDIDRTGTEINFDPLTSQIWGTLGFTSGDDDIADWKYKVRQRGPKGADGVDGSPFLEISEQVLGDPQLKSGSAIVSIRKSDLTNVINFLSNDLPDDVCVSNLSLSSSALPIEDVLNSKFIAAKVTTRRCKDVGFFKYDVPEHEPPPLDLPAWEPFEWWDLTDPKYPFRIVTPPRPNEQCCQEPFFWCPNVGDNPCGVNHWRCGGLEKLPSGAANAQGLACDGSAHEPILKAPEPHPPECDCDCDSPIAFELQNGGLSYGTVVLDAAQSSYSNGDVSVIDGRTDTYKVNFKASGNVDVVVQLDWEPNVCGGEGEENKNCQYKEDCAVHTTIIFEDNNSNAEISGGGASELSTVPGSASFTIRPLSGSDIDVVLNVMVNDTQSQCCRGYEIRVGAVSDAAIQAADVVDVQVVDGDWTP